MSKKQVTSGTKAKKTIVNIIIHIFLAILSFIWVLPIFWVVLTSFRGEKGSYVTTFFPKTYTINNYVKLFTDTSILNFPKMFVNTFIIAGRWLLRTVLRLTSDPLLSTNTNSRTFSGRSLCRPCE